ncbi:N-acyl homoserine lactonase family protein [Lewinella sp. W8]|uniref:N-acyl homoserine lactonase family protein n=1 Tax=Lewinella sp. W8 TaxID=2528208 RepID=UPI00106893DF|nr:N-acyl homoserine lactonase family protein [Lewinella sp. W8]MTB50143.1 MBL fold metallo-hydrolase [Lewinella sp. W8]
MESSVRRLAVLLCGYEFIPHSVSYHGGGQRFWHAVPVCCYLMDTEMGYVVVEGGLDERKLRDAGARQRYFPQRPGYPTPLVTSEHELLPQLAAMDVHPEMVTHVVLTHLHADHTGHTLAFPEASVHVQQKEWEYARQLTPAEGFIPEEFSVPADRLALHEGDWTLMPGVELLFTPGHTPGHQSVRVALQDGRQFLLVGDVVDDRRNMAENILPGGMTDPTQARASMERIRQIMDGGATGIFLHDAQQIQEIPLAPEWL